ncbi:Receptor protein kinase [Spatholobus suberectus]|nr:Receptor protein kinase [Spatholobus suberectus]
MPNADRKHASIAEDVALFRGKEKEKAASRARAWFRGSTVFVPCDWSKIQFTNDAVTKLLLFNKEIIIQKLPTTICKLKSLIKLDLFDNSIANKFLTLLYNYPNLWHLDLKQNYHTGAIPTDVDYHKHTP